MSQIMKAFMGIFLTMLLIVTATGMLGAFLKVSHAQNMHAAIIDEIENSNYARQVLADSYNTAKNASYSLQVKLYMRNGGIITCTKMSHFPDDTKDVIMAEVVLSYPVQIAFFNIDIRQEIFGYAR